MKPARLSGSWGSKTSSGRLKSNRSKNFQETLSSDMGWKLFQSSAALPGIGTEIPVASRHIVGIVWKVTQAV